MTTLRCSGVFLAICFLSLASLQAQTAEERLGKKHYEKWLNEDVTYIITDDERAVFSKLQTPEEKDSFIEEFWRRRSSDPDRNPGDFREEHYRRVAYANAHFGSGIPGWKTDRGRTYIQFGEPTEIEYHAGGENYVRPSYEGGGRTAVYPFQIWRYRHIDGIGDDIEIEFVDQSWTGLYKMSMNAYDKDMLLNIDGEGLTTSERFGLAKKSLRPGLHPGNMNDTTMISRYGMRSKDLPFERMMQYYQLQRPPVIRQKELQAIVQTRVLYNTLPLGYALNYVWLDSEKALVPITVEIDNAVLDFQKVFSTYKARVGLYGAVTSLNGRVMAEFEDTIASEYIEERFPLGQKQKSMYQRPVMLPAGIYKLDLVIKDLNAGKVGTVSTNINIPRPQNEKLAASPLVLAKIIQPMDTLPDAPQSFILGDLKVVPSVTRAYKPDEFLNVYFQVYNAGRDAADSKPKLISEYSILQGDKVVRTLADRGGSSIEYASAQRTVLARRISLKGLDAGKYQLKIQVDDQITGESLTRDAAFEIAAP
jgi:GWxTD domain-containing protein